MKFGKRLQEEIVPQWAEFYVNYKRLKQFIQTSELRGHEFSNEFFAIITDELGRAEGLFQALIEELQKVYDELLDMNMDMPHLPSKQRMGKFYRRRRTRPPAEVLEESALMSTATSTVFERESEMSEHRWLSWLKKFFLSAIGDFRARKVTSDTPKALLLEWNSNAHQLQHFAELNLEAIRKSAKKLKKYRRTEGDFTPAIEAELSRTRLTTLMPRLHNLVTNIRAHYERKFNEPLDHYADINLTQEWHAKWSYVFLAIVLFSFAMRLPLLQNDEPAHHCIALFILVIVLWVTEAIPFFCTAMLIPLVAVPLGIIVDPESGRGATPTVASQIILGKVFNHVQILVMGGLTIGKACARTNLEMYAASALHRYTGHRPSLYLLGIMLASCLLCSFVSNVAAPLLILGVIQRTLWDLPEGTKAPHGILLGLAFACNLGGMMSPIASPQNAVAMTALSFHDVTFAAWVGVALPVVLFCVIATWAIIIAVWKPFEDVPYIPLQVVNAVADRKVTTAERTVVLVVSLITIVLWVLPANLLFGDTGIVALIPIVVFFGIGILSKDDFNTLSWHLMFLLAGGNMLGLCARDSRMLDIMANSIKDTVTTANPYFTLVVVVSMVGILTTFVSHTVAAMILLPIIVKIGFLMPESHGVMAVTPQSLVMMSALMCSGAMAFPISSFPNVNSLLAEDEKGKPYLQAKDFLFCGTAVQLVFSLCIFSWMVPLTNFVLG